MTQWLLLRNGVLHCRGGAVSIAIPSASSSAAGVFTPLSTRSRLVLRRFSSAPDRHRRNHFKSNRDYKDKVREERSEADGKPKFSNWSLFDNTSGVGGRAASASAKSGGGAANGSSRANAPKKQRSGFGQRHGNDAAKKDPKQNFTNKFQNLLSFALDDDDDDDDDVGALKESPSPSRFGSKSADKQSPFVTSNNRNGRFGATQPKRVQAEEDESDDDDIFTDNNDLAISALALDHDDDDDARREVPAVSKVKKTAKPRAEEAKKKQLKHQKKKDGRSLLKSFKFENSIFGSDDDFFGDVEWDDRDNDMREERRFKRQQRKADRNAHKIVLPPQEVEIPTRILVKDLAERMSIKSKVLIRALRDLGEHATEDSVLVNEVAELVVESLNMIPVLLPPEFVDAELTIPPADCSAFPVRPPVVSVMGHVDHGKTTLLDALRHSKVAASEAGGITQTIGAFTVALGSQFGSMTFIDTPGHAAFSGMRSMGCEVTDMIVLVVAADDGVRPQTQEVVELAQKNKVPLVVAVTKVDMHSQSHDEVAQRISGELLTFGVVTESMGGDTPLVCVSSKTGEGLESLKETIALYAEVLDLRADTTPPGEAVVIESKMARGVGPQVDTVVKWGTLKTGAVVVCGLEYGKIRALIGPDGKTRVKTATPGMPVRVIGLKGLPKAGEPLLMVPSEDRAKEVVQQRLEMIEWDRLAATEEAEAQAMEANGEDGFVRRRRYMGAAAKSRQIEQRRQEAEDEAKRVAALKVGEHGYEAKIVPIIVKTDSMGVIAAIDDLIASLPTDEAVIKRIVGAVGPVSSSDLALAEATGATVYHFNVKHASAIDQEAFQKDVALRAHDVIYSLLDDIKALLEDHLGGVEETEVVGAAEILQQIPITKSGRRVVHIAGCRVTSGALGMQNKYRLVRDGQVVASDVSMETMRHFQDKVSEVTKGQECGLQLHGLESFQVGDVLEAYTVKIVKKRV